jgi:DNA-binding CsgD family transcriptional regulator
MLADAKAQGASGRNFLSQPGWYALLGDLVSQVGEPGFPDALAQTLGHLTQFAYTVTFAYNGPDVPLCLHHTFPPKQYAIHVSEYEVGPYLLDPLYKAATNGVRSGVFRLGDVAPDQFYKSEYYRSYYVQTGPVDEIAMFIPGNGSWTIVTSLMRPHSHPAFSIRELRALRCVEPLLGRIAQAHWRTDQRLKAVKPEQDDKDMLRRTVEDALRRLGMPLLTPRETEVVGLVLRGHSSESIANILGISAGTVRIHRKNVYAKMRISSQRELFSIFMQSPVYGGG